MSGHGSIPSSRSKASQGGLAKHPAKHNLRVGQGWDAWQRICMLHPNRCARFDQNGTQALISMALLEGTGMVDSRNFPSEPHPTRALKYQTHFDVYIYIYVCIIHIHILYSFIYLVRGLKRIPVI